MFFTQALGKTMNRSPDSDKELPLQTPEGKRIVVESTCGAGPILVFRPGCCIAQQG